MTALKSFPGKVQMHFEPEYEADMLAVWGACGQRQWTAFQRYRQMGRPVICFDVGHFNRTVAYKEHRQVKVALNDPHPEYLPDAPARRFDRLKIGLQSLSDPAGPVVVAGMGIKSRRWLYGFSDPRWELDAIGKARGLGKDVVYRPKHKNGETLAGIVSKDRRQYDIHDVLRGASLVISRHSNVCHVDAPLLGIPAVVETGPSVNLWPRDLRIAQRSADERLDYLRRLAWWSWSLVELQRGECWDWILSHARP